MAGEGFIQFIWKHRLYEGKYLYTTCGQKLEVICPGERNPHGGPDFLNARIRMDGLIWAGNVEIHPRASDWYRHRHHLDPSYNNVILHVVGDFDRDVTNSLGRRIQTLAVRYPAYLRQRYEILKRSDGWLACGEHLHLVPMGKVKHWLQRLKRERLDQKSRRMEKLIRDADSDLDLAIYRALAPGYGIPLNTLPFELLVKKAPLPVLLEHRDNANDLEAILFGQSGLLLPSRMLGSYPSTLWNRYTALKASFAEKPVPLHLWKFLRLRPPSFPTIRISQLASLLRERYPLAVSILESGTLAEMEQIFRVGASEYWTNHHLFGKASPPFPKYPGEQFISTLIINVIVPFLRALEKLKCGKSTCPGAGEILHNLNAESNQLIRNWSIFGIRADNAEESQALLQLYHYYCSKKRCLECVIGAEIVRNAIHEYK
jgi:hypothetical protein